MYRGRHCRSPPSQYDRRGPPAPGTLLPQPASTTCGSISSLNSDNLRDKMQPSERSVSRRQALLSSGAALCAGALPAAAAEDKAAPGKLKVAIFSKHLLFLKGDALAAGAA